MINIEIKQPVKLPGLQSMFITFKQFNSEAIQVVRELENRFYNAETKAWEVNISKLDYILNAYKKFEIEIKYNKVAKKESKLPKNFTYKTKPFAHQVDGVEYGLNNNCWILGDDQGLGKTKQLIDLAIAKKMLGETKQCLIVCGVNGLKYNWKKEIKTHSNEDCYILGMRRRRNGKEFEGSVADRIEDMLTRKEFFLITNVETLRNDDFVNAIRSRNDDIQMIAVDEVHKCKNSQSQQGHNLLKLKDFKCKIALSGTPIMNSPLDAYAILKWLGKEKSNLTTFKKFYFNYGGYGGYEVIGTKNLQVLRQSIESCMLRRLKKDVLDLPEKIRQIEYVQMGAAQRKVYNEAKDWVLSNIDKISRDPNPLSALLRMRQATGHTGILSTTINESAKIERLKEMVEDLVSEGKKCLVFSNWTQMTAPVMEALKNFNPVLITGEVDTQERQIAENKFQNDPNCSVCVGTFGAMGTGLTLTAATTVFQLDLPWNMALCLQAEDRAHRIGTTGTVNIITMICENTIDEKIYDLVQRKGEMADALIDGKIGGNRAKALAFLLDEVI